MREFRSFLAPQIYQFIRYKQAAQSWSNSTEKALAAFDAATLEPIVAAATEAAGLGHGKLNQPLRVAVTGSAIGAGIFETLEILGKEKSIKRLEYALANKVVQ